MLIKYTSLVQLKVLLTINDNNEINYPFLQLIIANFIIIIFSINS